MNADDPVDTSDIPELTDDELARGAACRGAFLRFPPVDLPDPALHRPRRAKASLRLDADVLAWLKAPGPGYQGRINALLRQAMLRAGDSRAGRTWSRRRFSKEVGRRDATLFRRA